MLAWLAEQADGIRFGITGFFGALISGWFQREDLKNKTDFAVFVFSGAITAHFLTGLVGEYFDVSPANAGGIGFLLGAFGGRFIQVVIRTIQKADVWQLVMGRWGGGGRDGRH